LEFGIGLLILFGVLFVILAKAHRNAQENAHEQSPKVKKANTPRKVKRDVFDASTAKTLEPGSVLEGRARILDGDSLIIQKTQVRLYGVDAPELNHPFGQKAKWALVALCKGQDIRAEVTEHDAYGRTVALCFLEDGRELSA
jgi:endonuclease YncB( thermonuclease family)